MVISCEAPAQILQAVTVTIKNVCGVRCSLQPGEALATTWFWLCDVRAMISGACEKMHALYVQARTPTDKRLEANRAPNHTPNHAPNHTRIIPPIQRS